MKIPSALQRANIDELAVRSNYNARVMAELCQLSPRQLQRIFKSALGCSPQRWLNDLRTFHAQQRLLAGEPVKHVAIELGFKRPAYFSFQFKTITGLSPSAFASQAPAPDLKSLRADDVAISKLISIEPPPVTGDKGGVPHSQRQ